MIRLDYRKNRLTDPHGAVHPIKRHYVQAVAGSPNRKRSEIELDPNEVIWLLAGSYCQRAVWALRFPPRTVRMRRGCRTLPP